MRAMSVKYGGKFVDSFLKGISVTLSFLQWNLRCSCLEY